MKFKKMLGYGYRCGLALMVILVICFVTSTNNYKQVIKEEAVGFNKNLEFNTYLEGTKKAEVKKTVKPVTKSTQSNNNTKANTNSGSLKTLSGSLTGYAADCPQCNGTLACMPKYNVYKNNVVTYNDKAYGSVRIVASSKNLPCGSIIRFNSSRVSSAPVYAIVLDRGVTGNNIDILMQTEKKASVEIGRSKITYEVLRSGW